MGTENKRIGLRGHARSPGSISNMEHHDPSGAHRGMDGTPAQIRSIHNDANKHAIEDDAIVRVFNDSGATAFIWFGAESDAPGVAPTIANGIAIPNGHVELFHTGAIDSKESVAFKTSSASVQVTVFKARV